MALTQGEKDKILRYVQERWSRNRQSCGFLKGDLSAALDDIDAWFGANVGNLNTAIGEPFRSAAVTEQKALLLVFVVLATAGLTPEALR